MVDYSEETYKKERHQYSKTIIINLSVPALKEQAYATQFVPFPLLK